MGIDRIKTYPDYKGVMISKDYNVYGENVYIGNGQGCATFWFKDAEEARKFIDCYRDKIKVNEGGGVNIIPPELCQKCKCHYSYLTPAWKKAKDRVCTNYKRELKLKSR